MNKHMIKMAVLSLGVLTGISCQHKSDAPNSRNNHNLSASEIQQLDTCRRQLYDGSFRFWMPQNDTTYFDYFFTNAEKTKTDGRTLRILHYGDSQIEADRITSQMRERMQQLFGGEGPGLVPFKQTVPALTVKQSTDGKLVGQSTYGRKPFVRCEGNYGPMLRSWHMDGTAKLSLNTYKGRYVPERVRNFSHVRILLHNLNTPTKMQLSAADSINSYICKQSGVQLYDFGKGEQTESIEMSLQGKSDIYGLLLDGEYGVAVDNIAMRGSAGTQFTMVDSLQLAQAYKMMDVGMILLQFGGNAMPGLTNQSQIAHYCKRIGAQIDYLHSVCPKAAIMFVGPADMGVKNGGNMTSHPMIAALDENLRDTALAHGAAYWSVYQAMGGDGSMARWVEQGLANKDYIHLSHKGAAMMGDILADALERQYQFYRLRNGIKS